MAEFYAYLIPSLPYLSFGQKAPLNFDKFLSLCERLIPEEDLQVLKQIDLSCELIPVENETIKAWRAFEVSLRNELVNLRAARRHLDSSKYLREEYNAQPAIAHALLVISRNPHLLDLERALDKFRWDFLEQLSLGHYFDLHALIVYAYKLLILEKWQMIDTAEAEKLLTEVMQ